MLNGVFALTDKEVRALPQRSQRDRVSDGAGLLLEVDPAGGKDWLWRHRFPPTKDGRRQDLRIGPDPRISLKAARDIRDEQKRLLNDDGINPCDAKKRSKDHRWGRNAQLTFEAVLRWLPCDHRFRQGRQGWFLDRTSRPRTTGRAPLCRSPKKPNACINRHRLAASVEPDTAHWLDMSRVSCQIKRKTLVSADSFRFAACIFIPAFEPIAVPTVIRVFHLPLGHSCIMDLKVYHQIESVIQEVLPIASYDITPELIFSDFGISSGDPVMQKFRSELEVFYPVEISNEELEQFHTVRDVASYISKKNKTK